MVLESGYFGKEMSRKSPKTLRDIFVEGIITIFVSHFLKNKNRYLHYMKKIYLKKFQAYMH